jgi:hypothetical protein
VTGGKPVVVIKNGINQFSQGLGTTKYEVDFSAREKSTGSRSLYKNSRRTVQYL